MEPIIHNPPNTPLPSWSDMQTLIYTAAETAAMSHNNYRHQAAKTEQQPWKPTKSAGSE